MTFNDSFCFCYRFSYLLIARNQGVRQRAHCRWTEIPKSRSINEVIIFTEFRYYHYFINVSQTEVGGGRSFLKPNPSNICLRLRSRIQYRETSNKRSYKRFIHKSFFITFFQKFLWNLYTLLKFLVKYETFTLINPITTSFVRASDFYHVKFQHLISNITTSFLDRG